MFTSFLNSIKTALHNRVVLFVLVGAALIAAPIVYWRMRSPAERQSCNTDSTQNEQQTLGATATTPTDPGNLLAGHWQMAGATLDSASGAPKLLVRAMQTSIVKQDGSAGQSNPPINLYGTCMQHEGSFTINAELTDIKGAASLSLYGKPPLVEDEYRAEMATLTIHLDGTTAKVEAFTTPGTRPSAARTAAISANGHHYVTITNNGGKVSIVIDQSNPLAIDGSALFSTTGVWFGASAASADGSFAITQLRAEGLNGKSVRLHDTSQLNVQKLPDGLAALAERKRPGFIMGASVALGPFVSDEQYRILSGNFSSFTTENALKFQFVHPMPGTDASSYDFSDADALVAIAQRSGIRVHGHTLVFGEANPAWVQQAARKHPDQLESVMTNHIRTVVGRYRGKIASWDVVNEPLADYDTAPGSMGLRKHIWYNAMGPDYIAKALRTAHDADPDAELWINEFGLETDDDRFAAMLALVTKLKQDGVPLTGVGFQSHLDDGDTGTNGHVDTATLTRHIQALAKIGLKARISELDVTEAKQYPAYGDIVSACLAQPNCTGVTTWGISDAYSSGGGIQDNGSFETGIGLMWDENMRPTAAFTALRRAL